jgi:hypothetical protein
MESGPGTRVGLSAVTTPGVAQARRAADYGVPPVASGALGALVAEYSAGQDA